MPQLITAYVPAVFFSQQNISFAAAGLNASNTKILYRVGNPTVSWVPDDAINPLTGLEYNRGYLIEPIADIVLADNVAQTQICQEQNPGGVPVGYVTILDILFSISGTQGFADGYSDVSDFAQFSKETIQKALLQAFKTEALEEPIKKLYAKLAADAQSGGGLDQTEIADFNAGFNQVIENALKIQQTIEQTTGQKLADLTNATSNNSLVGSIQKDMTEQTGTVIAGEFSGLRLTALDQLNVAKEGLIYERQIAANTAAIVARVDNQTAVIIDYFQNKGVKIA